MDKNKKASTKIFIITIVASFLVWLYLFIVDMQLINANQIPRFARSFEDATSHLSYRGLGWEVHFPVPSCAEDCPPFAGRVYLWNFGTIILTLAIYLFVLFILSLILGKILTWRKIND